MLHDPRFAPHEESEDAVKASQARIKQYDRDIQEALENRVHDPFRYDKEIRMLTALKNVELERIALMADSRLK
jgi:hypothetical protein